MQNFVKKIKYIYIFIIDYEIIKESILNQIIIFNSDFTNHNNNNNIQKELIINQIKVLNESKESKSNSHNNTIQKKLSIEIDYLNEEVKLIDFSDLNQVFNIVKKQTIENNTNDYFLSLMQNLFIIPLNKSASKNIWKSLVNYLKEIINASENNENGFSCKLFLLKNF